MTCIVPCERRHLDAFNVVPKAVVWAPGDATQIAKRSWAPPTLTSHFLFLNYVLYLLKHQVFSKST